MLDAELLQILNQIPGAIEKALTAFIERHPGHANQKTHGNRFGAGQAKESLRRLKDDKGAREAYKDTHRKRGQGSGASSGVAYPDSSEIKQLAKSDKQGLMTFDSKSGKQVMVMTNTGSSGQHSRGKFSVIVFDKGQHSDSRTFGQSAKQLGSILDQLKSKDYRHIKRG